MTLIRSRQRSITALFPHQANQKYLIPKQFAVQPVQVPELFFGGTTRLDIPLISDTTVEVAFAIDVKWQPPASGVGADRACIYSDLTGFDFSWVTFDRPSDDVHSRIFNVNDNAAGFSPLAQANSFATFALRWEAGTSQPYDIALAGDPGSPFQANKGTGTSGTGLVYGAIDASNNSSSTNFIGVLRNLRIYSDNFQTLVHQYLLDEGSGTVANDSVGTADGTITLGNGGWQ
jgi:hypothetical protein